MLLTGPVNKHLLSNHRQHNVQQPFSQNRLYGIITTRSFLEAKLVGISPQKFTISAKYTMFENFACNFAKCSPIVKILSPADGMIYV